MYRAVKRGYAVVAIGTHLSQAAFNFHCFNTTWPPEDHIEGPEVCVPCCHTEHTFSSHPCTVQRAAIPTYKFHAKHYHETTTRYCHGRAYAHSSMCRACSW